MDLFSINFTVHELQLLRQSLNVITINGTDAQFVANLQLKLEHELKEIERLTQEQPQIQSLPPKTGGSKTK
jgi:hypothetical protein